MARLSQTQKIALFLKEEQPTRYTAKRIAEAIITKYPEDYVKKRANDRFSSDDDLIAQVAAEIGAQKDGIKKIEPNISWQDKPRPRVYFYDTNFSEETEAVEDEEIVEEVVTSSSSKSLTEHELYPVLVDYLKSELKLYCMRIDERRSKNSRGNGGNQWLHPDIVAMQTVDKEWHEFVRSCVQQGAGQSVRLWSFEVKKELNSSNVRKSFFQAVSNSSWANEGYLVATSITDSSTEQELRMLAALHGIGVILLNTENPSESEMMLPAKSRAEVDWQSINRILVENPDFKDYIELVSTYYQTGRVRSRDWNKV